MKAATDEATLRHARELFGPVHKLELLYGTSGRTVCDHFTAGGQLVLKTNTGAFRAAA